MNNFNQQVIAEFRANRGRVVRAAGFGRSLVLLHTEGARSGQERINPVLARRDGDDWLITASAAGARQHPAWFINLRAHLNTVIETGDGVVPVAAEELTGDEYAPPGAASSPRARRSPRTSRRRPADPCRTTAPPDPHPCI